MKGEKIINKIKYIMMTNEQKAAEILGCTQKDCDKCDYHNQTCFEYFGCTQKDCDKCDYHNQTCFEYKHLMKMANWKDEQYELAKDKDVTGIDWKAVYDAEVVRHAELKAELDVLKGEHAKAQQQLAEYRRTLAELSNTNSKLVKDIAALAV